MSVPDPKQTSKLPAMVTNKKDLSKVLIRRMRYLEIDTEPAITEGKIPWWGKLLRRVLPAASSDLEPYFDRARVWWVEIDDNGEPLREIGFDENGDAIVLGPVEGNYGLLLDSPTDWSESTGDTLKAAENFDRVWKSLWPKFEELDRHNRLKTDLHHPQIDRRRSKEE